MKGGGFGLGGDKTAGGDEGMMGAWGTILGGIWVGDGEGILGRGGGAGGENGGDTGRGGEI